MVLLISSSSSSSYQLLLVLQYVVLAGLSLLCLPWLGLACLGFSLSLPVQLDFPLLSCAVHICCIIPLVLKLLNCTPLSTPPSPFPSQHKNFLSPPLFSVTIYVMSRFVLLIPCYYVSPCPSPPPLQTLILTFSFSLP